MISAWSYVLVECFLYLKFLSISVNLKLSPPPPPSLCYVVMYVRWYANYAKAKSKKKAKRRNYSRNVNCLFLDCKDRFCVWIMKKNLFYLFFISPKHRFDLMKKEKKKKEIIKLKRMSICFQKEQNSKENLVLNKISGSIYHVCFFSIYPVKRSIIDDLLLDIYLSK